MKYLVLSLLVGCAFYQKESKEYEQNLLEYSKTLHHKILTLDTHVDINLKNFRKERHPGMRLPTQVDLLKMQEGGLDSAFFIVFTSQKELNPKAYADALDLARKKFSAIKSMAQLWNSKIINLTTSVKEVKESFQEEKLSALIGVENSYPLGLNLELVSEFYAKGARYISLTHNGHNQFADSNIPKGDQPATLYNGLSSLGVELVKELNKQGIMVDVSHASKKSMLQAIKVSKAPVIASHSAVKALCNHPRNLDDEQLLALKKNGGVIQIVAFDIYLKEKSVARKKAEIKLKKKYGLHPNYYSGVAKLSDQQRIAYQFEFDKLRKEVPGTNVSDLVDHIDYVVNKIGIDHVGVASDFDGGGGIDGWTNASETLNITKELVRRGYNFSQIQKIWSGNLLRVLGIVEKQRL